MTLLKISLLWLAFSLILPVSAEPLKATIELSSELAPVRKELQTGAKFNEQALPPVSTNGVWYWVPPWLAGGWHRETMTYLLPVHKRGIHKERSDSSYGLQVDRLGGHWQRLVIPSRHPVECTQLVDWKITTRFDVLETNNFEFINHSQNISVAVNKRTGKIMATYQQESIQRYYPIDNNHIKYEVTTKEFDQSGRFVSLNEGSTIYTRTSPFIQQNIDEVTGVNLRLDFYRYLVASDLRDLIP